jgi:hypothetical protein
VTGEWIELHYDELRDLYSSPSLIKKDQVEEYVT